jgi:hypothetical protein
VLNLRVGWLLLFEKPADYVAFERILGEVRARATQRNNDFLAQKICKDIKVSKAGVPLFLKKVSSLMERSLRSEEQLRSSSSGDSLSGGRFMNIPSRKHQHGGTAAKRPRQNFGSFYAQIYVVAFNSGDGGLRNRHQSRQLALRHLLKLVHDLDRFSH